MKNKLLLTGDSLQNQISYYLIMLLLVTLPFDKFYSQTAFICFAVHTLIHLRCKDLDGLWNIRNLALISVFLITLISLTYTHFFNLGLDELTRLLLVLLIPVFFAINPFNFSKYRDRLLLVFSVVCVGCVLFLYTCAFRRIIYFHLPLKSIFSDTFVNHHFSAPLGIHATFFSLQVAIALVNLLLLAIKETKWLYRCLCAAGMLFLTAGIVQLGSKAILVALVLTVVLAIPILTLRGRARLRFALISAALSAMVIGGALKAKSFKERYVAELKTDFSQNTSTNESADPRLVRWQTAAEIVYKRPILGYGSGAELPLLMDAYFQKKLYSSYLFKLNAHNQYITFLITSGIVGLLFYLCTLGFGFATAYIRHDVMLMTFILLITTVSISESLLNAEKSVYFYALFFSFLVYALPRKTMAKGDTKTQYFFNQRATKSANSPSF
ncbi:O-antigen ligase [Mucilaginibacter yixingensis]|uniref:O-antigen ligase n=2 Tax=Mucilaginibacter yixingensis TaxID=1295612 RepID=A0A2T5J7J8_9SPHI|nr:O-antigen ligase [Mucilaginibacter yixingensis]